MKILHINGTNSGGTANFAINLHKSLRKKNIDSYIYLPNNHDVENILFSNSYILNIYKVFRVKFTKLLNKFFLNVRETTTLGFFRSFQIQSVIKKNKPDIINIHWVGDEFFSLFEILEIKVPIIITIHDMWFFKPIEHYNDLTIKKNSTHHNLFKKIIFNFFLNLKKKIGKKNMEYIFTSDWMIEQAILSNVIERNKIRKINCGIDFERWFPIDKKIARENLNIDPHKKVILFSAMGINNKRKGFNDFLRSINKIKGTFQIIISSDEKPKKPLDLDYIYFNSFNSPEKRRELYSAADVCVAPSKIEAFGLVALESCACNTPVVVFSNNGLSEIISHKKNGYIAEKSSSVSFAEGINWVFNKLDSNPNYFEKNRQLVKKFDIDNIASQYIEAYKKKLNLNK